MKRLSNFSNKTAVKVENIFFAQEDQKLIEALKKMKEMEETKESLKKVSGIKNEKVLTKLIELNVRPETLAAISAIPLIEVAWADGKVDDKEKEIIINEVKKCFSEDEGIELSLIKEWLMNKPPRKMLEVWQNYIEGLCENFNKEELDNLKNAIMKNTKAVAEASGGFFGLGRKISKEEERMLKILIDSFSI